MTRPLVCLLAAVLAVPVKSHAQAPYAEPPLRLVFRDPSPAGHRADARPVLVGEYGAGRYAGMLAGGTLGSAVGLVTGVLGAAVVAIGVTNCLDCGDEDGMPRALWIIPAVTTTLGAAGGVAAVAWLPRTVDRYTGAGPLWRSEAARPALAGAAAGVVVGAALGLLVAQVSPPDEPYPLLAFSIGQSAVAVAAVRISVGR